MMNLTIYLLIATILQASYAKTFPEEGEGPRSVHGDPLLASTEHGAIRGKYYPKPLSIFSHFQSKSHQARLWAGIPFADPPIEENRFRPPQPYSQPWGKVDKDGKVYGDVKDMTMMGPPCYQIMSAWTLESEDCLYLNVFAPPAIRNKKNLPVMVWFYGGAYIFGDGYQFGMYDGRHLVEKHDVILITFNYRLGPLGFFASGNTKDEREGVNLALMDQLAVLKWVKKNIAGFGGDPDNVTIFGESAGATSVASHIALQQKSNLSLFHRAWIMSIPLSLDMIPVPHLRNSSLKLAKKVGCVFTRASQDTIDMDCMRSIPVSKLTLISATVTLQTPPIPRELMEPFYWWPAVDNVTVHGQLRHILHQQGASIPIVMGFNRDETGLWDLFSKIPAIGPLVVGKKAIYQKEGNQKRLAMIFGESIGSQVEALYEFKDDPAVNRELQLKLSTDYIFTCPALYAAKGIVQNSTSLRKRGKDHGGNVWMYHFTMPGTFPANLGPCHKKVCHTSDLLYFFREMKHQGKEARKLAVTLQQYLVAFATHGSPNMPVPRYDSAGDVEPTKPSPLINWPSYTPTRHEHMEFGKKIGVGHEDDMSRQGRCAWWDQFGYRL